MALNLNKLSLWEIAHRWHGVDPQTDTPATAAPLEVKDTLRILAAEIYYERLYSDLWLEREEEKQDEGFLKSLRKAGHKRTLSDYSEDFKNCLNGITLDRSFLQSVMVPRWELEYWCEEYNVEFPSFWLRSPSRRGNLIPVPGARPFREEVEAQTDAPSDSEISQQEMAARARHERVNTLKRECVQYSKDHPTPSYRECARRYYDSLPEDRRTLAPTNAVRTLAQALSDYEKGKDCYWMQAPAPDTD